MIGELLREFFKGTPHDPDEEWDEDCDDTVILLRKQREYATDEARRLRKARENGRVTWEELFGTEGHH